MDRRPPHIPQTFLAIPVCCMVHHGAKYPKSRGRRSFLISLAPRIGIERIDYLMSLNISSLLFFVHAEDMRGVRGDMPG